MRRSAAASALGSEFNNFLFAPIDGVSDEMPFCVLSVLARHNVDPWEEAAELVRLSTESAIVRLSSVITSVSTGPSTQADPTSNAARLVALLPRSAESHILGHNKPPKRAPLYYLAIIVCLIVVALIIASALLSNWR
jgi:hypothetical protein